MLTWLAFASGVETVKGRRAADREIVESITDFMMSLLCFFFGDFGELAAAGEWYLLFIRPRCFATFFASSSTFVCWRSAEVFLGGGVSPDETESLEIDWNWGS